MVRDTAVNRVMIAKIIRRRDRERAEFLSQQRGQLRLDVCHHGVGRLGLDLFVIMARVVVAAVLCPVFFHNFFDRLTALGEYRQPEQHCPNTVFFSNMV